MNTADIPVSFLDLRAGYEELASQIDEAILRVARSGWYIGGPEVEAFENEYAAYCRVRHCVGVGNGLDALTLALRAFDIGAGDEVIVPSNTYIATWLAVDAVGAIPVPVEPDPATHNIDPGRIAEAITAQTKAIIPVHLYGQPADLDAILLIARQNGIRVIEDAAQAQGARFRTARIGTHGDAVCWSFYPGKNLGALGDAGAITTNDRDIADRIRLLGNYGSAEKYVFSERGVNSRLDPIQAAVLRVRLRHLEQWNLRRKLAARRYSGALACLELVLPEAPAWADPVWHQYVVRSRRRDFIRKELSEAGISTMIHYPIPPHMQGAFAHLKIEPDALPVARRLSEEVFSLPIGPQLTEMEQDRVIAVLTGLCMESATEPVIHSGRGAA